MFHLFKKKEADIKTRDIIWITSEAKWNYILQLWKKNNNSLFICWFEDTKKQAEDFFSDSSIELIMAREAQPHHIQNKTVFFAEHFPLPEKEENIFRSLHLKEVTVISSLDEPLFKHFGSDKIIEMMKKMGINENEPVENAMISHAIRNAQEKIEKKTVAEQLANSQADWLKKNLP